MNEELHKTGLIVKLAGYCRVADMHAQKLSRALETTKKFLPVNRDKLSILSDSDSFALDSLASRFTKLQDLMGTKIFPLILKHTEGDLNELSYIDKLNLLEKKDFLPSTNQWQALRVVRNEIAHEYPDDDMIQQHLGELVDSAQYLLNIWDHVHKKIMHLK